MAQTSNFVPQHSRHGFVVVNQQPSRREAFPYRLQINWILAFGIAKCILGTLLFITGIVNVAIVDYNTHIAFGIWCGLTIIANGILGCILKCRQSKCLIGGYLGLSITSLIFSISMLSFYSAVLEYFVNVRRVHCYSYYYPHGLHRCHILMTSSVRDLGIGITSFLIALIVFELACSIGSVVVSCKAFSKCCNTCNPNDCCIYLGCCECDCTPLNIQQGGQPAAPTYSHHQDIQMVTFQPPNYQPSQQRAQSNPCSDIVSFIINIPSYVFGVANGSQLSAINVNLQPITSNQQVPVIEHGRTVEQIQGANVLVGDTQPNSALLA